MSLESVVQVILERGAAEASQIVDAARTERERILAEVRAEEAKALAETEASCRADGGTKRGQRRTPSGVGLAEKKWGGPKETIGECSGRSFCCRADISAV